MCLRVITCNFTQEPNNEQLLLDGGCWRLRASHLPTLFLLYDCIIFFHSGFSIVHQYIQHFNEVSGNKSGNVRLLSAIMLKLYKVNISSPLLGIINHFDRTFHN